jgi:hypothetical protein
MRMYRSPRDLEAEQHAATGDIETTLAYQPFDGSEQLIVPTTDENGKVSASRTVHTEFCPELSITERIRRDKHGTYYKVVPREVFYPTAPELD